MLWYLLVGVPAALGLLVALAASRPAAYRVERTLEVPAPPGQLFPVLEDLRRFVEVLVLFGSPLGAGDPSLERTFEGPGSGVGQVLRWSGRKAGKGRLTIEQSVPGQQVTMALELAEPMTSTARYTLRLVDRPAGCLVTWTMEGRHNLLGRVFGLFLNMDRLVGADLEKGLLRLKALGEVPPAGSKPGSG